MKIAIVAAIGPNRVIGRAGRLPWQGEFSADLKRFKALTTGHVVIMGRRTFESIGNVLSGRVNIVVTSNPSYAVRGGYVVKSFESAIAFASFMPNVRDAQRTVFVIGGRRMYEQALECADVIYLTKVQSVFQGDTYFPDFCRSLWKRVSLEHHEPDDRNHYPYSFEILERITPREEK